MANSTQLGECGVLAIGGLGWFFVVCLFVGFLFFFPLQKTVGKNSGTYVKNYRNIPELLFHRPFQYPVIFLLWNIYKI